MPAERAKDHLRQDGFVQDAAALFSNACAVIVRGWPRGDDRSYGKAAPTNPAFV